MNVQPQTSRRLTAENILHIAICAGMLLLFVVLALRPQYLRYAELLERSSLLKSQIAAHTVLISLHTELTTAQGCRYLSKFKTSQHVPLSTHDFTGIHAHIETIATQCAMMVLDLSPRVSDLSNKRQFLGVNIMAEGDFTDMQTFLNCLMELPSFYYLETLRISEGVGCEQIEVLVWLSVE